MKDEQRYKIVGDRQLDSVISRRRFKNLVAVAHYLRGSEVMDSRFGFTRQHAAGRAARKMHAELQPLTAK